MSGVKAIRFICDNPFWVLLERLQEPDTTASSDLRLRGCTIEVGGDLVAGAELFSLDALKTMQSDLFGQKLISLVIEELDGDGDALSDSFSIAETDLDKVEDVLVLHFFTRTASEDMIGNAKEQLVKKDAFDKTLNEVGDATVVTCDKVKFELILGTTLALTKEDALVQKAVFVQVDEFCKGETFDDWIRSESTADSEYAAFEDNLWSVVDCDNKQDDLAEFVFFDKETVLINWECTVSSWSVGNIFFKVWIEEFEIESEEDVSAIVV